MRWVGGFGAAAAMAATSLFGPGTSPPARPVRAVRTVQVKPPQQAPPVTKPRPASGLCGARLPDGFHIAHGYPARDGDRFHPQEIGLFFQQVLASREYTPAVRRCLLGSTAKAVAARGIRRQRAILFPYSFDLSYDRVGSLQAPWFSGLAQATLMGSLRSIASVVGDTRFEKFAQKTFNAFFLKPSEGGFMTYLSPRESWVQEYVTQTPSFVLNGHLFAILAARSFGANGRDGRGRELFEAGARATARLLPLFDIPTPAGPRSAYDLTRRHAGAPLRVSGPIAIRRIEVVDKGGTVLSALPASREVRPAYPVSVLRTPRVFVRISYRGSGRLEARDKTSWVSVGSLPGTSGERVIEIPPRFQGRADAGRYHQIHVDLLRRMARATGDATFSRWATRWEG